MLRGKPTLASVLLCFACLLDLTLQSAIRPCSEDMIKNVQYLIDTAPNSECLDCRLYTPSVQDYQKCPGSTLRCFAEEIKVLIKEWPTIPGRGYRLDRRLESVALKLNKTESSCLQCEVLQEENVEKFLTDLRTTLEAMNSQNC